MAWKSSWRCEDSRAADDLDSLFEGRGFGEDGVFRDSYACDLDCVDGQ
jgi:hypothetical protein